LRGTGLYNVYAHRAGLPSVGKPVGGRSGQDLRVSRERLSPGELRERLRQWLPEYMAPAAIVELESMPLTVNGKVDRKALPAPVMREELEEVEETRTAVEEIIAGVWAEVLRLGR